ncbi:hypothetical protein FQN54_007280 [Arachnomyces sp. PD_36]|nr:hypothetical protein FQN54_007280 [Arachnomyces sp. PD_36]
MARLFAWAALIAGACAASHHQGGQASGLPFVLSTGSSGHKSGYGGGYAAKAAYGGYGGGYGHAGYGGYGYGYGGNSNIQVGITIITTNAGGGAQNQEWNNPPMKAGVTHQVTVGGEAGLVFAPEQLTAAVGDMVQFNFQSENHTVTQSGFDTPCDRLAGGIDSGFMPNPTDSVTPPPTMMFQVTTTEPVWMYCRQEGHCGQGMVFSINPTADKSHEAFKANAIASAQVAAPPPPPPAASSSVPPPSTPPVIGSSSVAVVVPPAATPPAGGNVAQGSGYLGSGDACSCSCLCSAGAFPAGAGIGAVGGLGGTMLIGPA